MGERTGRGMGHFRDDAARARFLAAYDSLLATWPEPPSSCDVPTTVGSTHVNSLDGGGGTPVVLLHPLAVSSASWYANAGAFAAAGHPVHAVDTITDAGRSTQTARLRGDVAIAGWLDEVLDGLGLRRAHLVGVSYGAWLAMNQARHARARLLSVTAIDPPAAVGRPPLGLVAAMARGAIAGRIGRSDDALYPPLRLLHNGALPEAALLELSVASIRGFVVPIALPRRFSDSELAAFTTPMLYLVGGNTPVVNARRAAERVQRLVPSIDTAVVAGAGHALPLERPVEVNERILRFLDKVDAGTD